MNIDISKVNLSEKDIEDWLYENPGAIECEEIGKIQFWFARQYSLPSGIADLIGYISPVEFVVVEVKNVAINKAAVLQVCRYAKDFEVLARVASREWPNVYRLLIGPSIDGQTFTEAAACDVHVLSFAATVKLQFGTLNFADDYIQHCDSVYRSLSVRDEWSWYKEQIEATKLARPHANGSRRSYILPSDDNQSMSVWAKHDEVEDEYDELMDAIVSEEQEPGDRQDLDSDEGQESNHG